MLKASSFFTEEDRKLVEKAVAEAEEKTSGEIVPVVASKSGRYDRAEDVVGVVLGIVIVALVWALFQEVRVVPGQWGEVYELAVGLPLIAVLFAGGFVGGALLATYFPLLAYPLIPKKELREEVQQAARRAFFEHRVRGTKEGTGVLIYVSLFERMVVVLGDGAISAQLGREDWEQIRDLVLQGLKEGKGAEGLARAIRRAGELLAKHFPIQSGDRNELPNTLHLID